MSDLAPLVASVLRDRAYSELRQELVTAQEQQQRLEAELHRRNAKLVRITGPGGFPVYAERSLELVEVYGNDGIGFRLPLINSIGNDDGRLADAQLPMCPVGEVATAEIHIGNEQQYVLGEFNYDIQTKSGIGDPQVYSRHLFFGPMESNDEDNLQTQTVVNLKYGPLPAHIVMPDPEDLRNTEIMSSVRFQEVIFPRSFLPAVS